WLAVGSIVLHDRQPAAAVVDRRSQHQETAVGSIGHVSVELAWLRRRIFWIGGWKSARDLGGRGLAYASPPDGVFGCMNYCHSVGRRRKRGSIERADPRPGA